MLQVLADHGFRYEEAATPEAALKLVAKHAGTLLITSDMDISGRPDLAQATPGHRTVVITGDATIALPPEVAATISAEEAGSCEALTEVLQSVAREVAYSRRRDTMLRWLERESERDAVTGLFTREAFEIQLAAACEAARQPKPPEPVCVIIVDVPAYRVVKELSGAEAAQETLHRAATAIMHSIRMTDVAGRLATDTIGIALPGASLSGGKLVARRLLRRIDEINDELEDDQMPLSLEFGVASGRDCSGAELIEAAIQQVAMERNIPVPLRLRLVDSDGPSVA